MKTNCIMKPSPLQERIGIDPDPLLGCMFCGKDDAIVHARLQSMNLCPDCFVKVMIAGIAAVRLEEVKAA